MIARLIFLALALAILAVLVAIQRPENSAEVGATAPTNEPGFVATGTEIIETGDNGQPLYRLDAERINQPVPEGTIYLTNPILHYQPPGANAWVLTAHQGELPQSARTADLSGAVQAEGKPSGSAGVMQISTDRLHVDMERQLASTPDAVHVTWAGSLLHGEGLRANLKSGQLELFHAVGGQLQH